MDSSRKIICYIAASLDGYIATPDDSLDWLMKTEGEGDAGYAEFMETIDTIICGKRTYDWVVEREGEFPYKEQTCYVFTRTPGEPESHVRFVNEDIALFADKLKRQDGENIWLVGGSQLLHEFLKRKLVDEFIISIAPVVIGKGIPLFQELEFEIDFTLKSVKRYGQFAQMHYEVQQ
ncbi:dihydrofolate reductase family protein [Planococcus salinus]|uniref:Dihydrofolate reductase n=1 Tax=Planococcus salinus TaxID=1848460 RepID=A0A3M8P4W0_9BACL|nr:dihydrofolate reductase family protein [Planococcus salinus]RNF38703.1 dihydrofolate reductase [Planococcus salinus]